MSENEKVLEKAVDFFLKELLGLKKEEKFLIYADYDTDDPLRAVIKKCAQEIGALIEEYYVHPANDVVPELIAKVKQNRYDVICELTDQTLYQTSVWRDAGKFGTRIYSLSGVDSNAFLRYVGGVNHKLMIDLGNAIKDILCTANTIKIITRNGTNISMRMRLSLISRVIRKLNRRPGTFVVEPSGIAAEGGKSTFVGGQLAFQGVLESIEGAAVIDGYLWPPKEIGLLNVPVILKIKKGQLIEISGCLNNSVILQKWFGTTKPEVEHFCIGFNPKATFSGSLMEAERVFGCITVGIGKYPLHIDDVMTNPSILADEKTIEQDGHFINQTVS